MDDQVQVGDNLIDFPVDDFVVDHRYLTVHLPVLIFEAFEHVKSKSEARRLLRDGAFKINGEKCHDLTCAIMDVNGKVIQVGKRHFREVLFA